MERIDGTRIYVKIEHLQYLAPRFARSDGTIAVPASCVAVA